MYYINTIYKNRVNIIWAPDTKTVQFFVYFVTDLVVSYRCLIRYSDTEDNHILARYCTIFLSLEEPIPYLIVSWILDKSILSLTNHLLL